MKTRKCSGRENTRRMFIQLMMLSSGHSAQLATWAPRKTRRHSARFFDLTHSQSPAYLSREEERKVSCGAAGV